MDGKIYQNMKCALTHGPPPPPPHPPSPVPDSLSYYYQILTRTVFLLLI